MSQIAHNLSSMPVENPSPANLPMFLPFACGQLCTPFTVNVQTKVQEEYVSKVEDKIKKGKKSMAALHHILSSDEEALDKAAVTTFSELGDDEIKVIALVDTSDQLIGLSLNRCSTIPRVLLKIVGLCVPFCSNLSSLVIQFCKLSGVVVYEMAKFLPQSQITEIYLDDSPMAEAERCYHMLLDRPTKLRSLSLARCNLTDNDCEVMFAQLVYPLPASKTLMTLNLTGNFISDYGTRSIGNCLRINRTLQYINLAGNQISDDGAAHIFNSIVKFPLTVDEIFKKKQRFIDFLRLRQKVFEKFYKEITNVVATGKALDEFSRSSKRKASRAKESRTASALQITRTFSSKDLVSGKAEMMTEEFVGRYSDPFSTEETIFQDDYTYCTGNMSLCCLNLAYNNLGYVSVKRLIDVVKYQSSVLKSSGMGLLYVQLQGNNMPISNEMNILEDLLEQALLSRMARIQSPRRERPKSKK